MKINKSLLSAALLAGFLPLAVHAASDTWTGNGSDNIFSNNANWTTAAPGNATNTSSFDVATFGAESGGSPDYTVNLNATRSLGTLTFGTGALGYSLSGSAIRLNGTAAGGGNVITIPAALTSQSTIGISNNISLYSSSNATTNSAWTISNNTNNATGFSTLNLSGNITVDPLVTTGTTGTRILTVSGGSTANATGLASASVINLTGVISDGTSNANVLKLTTGAGITKISGSNTYSGLTTVGAGLLLVGNNNALGTGSISFGTSGAWMGVDGMTARTLANNWSGVADNFVGFGASSAGNSSASYGINNTNAGKLTLSGNGSIGRATSGAKTFSYYQDLEFSGIISSDPITGGNVTGITLNGNLNNQTAVLTLSNANTFDKAVTLNNAIVSINTIGNVGAATGTSLGIAGNATTGAIIFSGANFGTTLRYTGGDTTTDRAVTLNNTSQAIIEASGSGTITFTSALAYSGTANHTGTLTLAGSNAGNNTFSGLIANNGSGAVGITKGGNSANSIPGGGLWVLGNSTNSYTGITTINDGVLSVSSLANGNSTSSIGASASTATNLVIGGNGTATLRYTGGVTSTDRLLTIGTAVGSIGKIESSGSGALSFTNNGSLGTATANGTHTIVLGGTNTGANDFALRIRDNGTGKTNVTKTDAGTWSLSNTGTASDYTGNTTVTVGTLIAAASKSLGNTSNLIVNGGTLDIRGSATTGNVTLGPAANFSLTTGTIKFQLGTAFDQLVSSSSGAFTITGGTFALDVLGAGFSYANTYAVLSGFGGSNSVSGLGFTGYDTGSYSAALSNTGVLSFTAVPEPATWALLAFSLTTVMVLRRRRQS